jgi:hypothetical protein
MSSGVSPTRSVRARVEASGRDVRLLAPSDARWPVAIDTPRRAPISGNAPPVRERLGDYAVSRLRRRRDCLQGSSRIVTLVTPPRHALETAGAEPRSQQRDQEDERPQSSFADVVVGQQSLPTRAGDVAAEQELERDGETEPENTDSGERPGARSLESPDEERGDDRNNADANQAGELASRGLAEPRLPHDHADDPVADHRDQQHDPRGRGLHKDRHSFLPFRAQRTVASLVVSGPATSTGHDAVRTTRSVWVPKTRSEKLSWPLVDITIRSTLSSWARRVIASPAPPVAHAGGRGRRRSPAGRAVPGRRGPGRHDPYRPTTDALDALELLDELPLLELEELLFELLLELLDDLLELLDELLRLVDELEDETLDELELLLDRELELEADGDELDESVGSVGEPSVQPANVPTPAKATLPESSFKNSRRSSRCSTSFFAELNRELTIHPPA